MSKLPIEVRMMEQAGLTLEEAHQLWAEQRVRTLTKCSVRPHRKAVESIVFSTMDTQLARCLEATLAY
jgi:hypothetical protein